jgi:MFS family permease
MKFGMKKFSLSKDIIVLLFAELLTHLGAYLFIPIFPVILGSDKGIDPTKIGLIIGMISLTSQIGNILGGLLSDRVGRKTTIALGSFIEALAVFGYGVSNEYLSFLVCSMIFGLGNGIYSPSVKASIASLTSKSAKTRTTAFSIRGIAANSGVGIAGLLILILVNGKSSTIFFIAGSIFLALGIITSILLPKGCGDEECPKIPINSYMLIIKNKAFIIYTLASILVWAIFAQLNLLIPLRADAVLDNGKMVGIIWTITSIIVIVFQGIISKYILQKINPFSGITIGVLFFGLGLFLIGISYNFLLLTLSASIFLIGQMLVFPTIDSITSQLAHAELIGAYFSVANLISGIGNAFGNFLGGKIISIYGINTNLFPWTIFAIFALTTSIIMFMVQRIPIISKSLKSDS